MMSCKRFDLHLLFATVSMFGPIGCDGDDGDDSADTSGADSSSSSTTTSTGSTSSTGTGGGETSSTSSSTSADGSSESSASDESGSTAATVHGTVTYAGDLGGTLIVGLFSSNPPAGPPAVFPPFLAMSPEFPADYAVADVPPGTYYVIALLDQPVDGGTAGNNVPDEGEPYAAATDPVVVEAGGDYEVDLTLVVP